MEKKFLLPLAVFALAFILAGCPTPVLPPANESNVSGEIKVVVSPITITDETVTLVIGNASWLSGNQTNITNVTIPDYTYEPNKSLFIFFMNTSLAGSPYANFTNERQGEAILLKKGDADILIDSGPSETSTDLVNFLREKGVDDIELYVSTHARPENYGGLDAVLDNFDVEQFMWSGDTGGDAAYSALVEKAKAKAKRTIQSSYLMNISINGIDLLVINPRDGSDRFFTIDNDGIAFKITNGNFSLMTTGDIAFGAQTKIAGSKDFSPECTVLQIPNYGLGQGTAQIDFFLSKVSPEAAIITGSYFDPAKEKYSIEEKLRVKGIPYYTTFDSANNTLNVVRIASDGYNYSISAQ